MDSSTVPAGPGDDLAGLRRSRDDAAVAGVCSSLARHLRIDPLLVRLAVVILALSSGLGVLLYAAAWFLLPQQGVPRSLAQQWFPQLDAWPLRAQAKGALVACLVGCLLLAQVAGWSIAPGIVLVLLVLLARRWQANQPTPPDPTVRTEAVTVAGAEFVAAVEAWQRRLAELEAQPVTAQTAAPAPVAIPAPNVPASSPAWTPPEVPAHPRAVRARRSWLLGLVLLAAAVLAGLLVPTDGVAEPRLLQHAVTLGVLGLGLLLSWLANLPRPRMAVLAGIIAVASALTPTPTSLEPVDVAWTSPHQIPAQPVRVVASDARYDLSGMDLAGAAQPRRFVVDATAADVEVVLPYDAVVRVDYRLRAADIEIDGPHEHFTDDGGRSGSWTSRPDQQPDLVLDLTLSAASAEVHHG